MADRGMTAGALDPRKLTVRLPLKRPYCAASVLNVADNVQLVPGAIAAVGQLPAVTPNGAGAVRELIVTGADDVFVSRTGNVAPEAGSCRPKSIAAGDALTGAAVAGSCHRMLPRTG